MIQPEKAAISNFNKMILSIGSYPFHPGFAVHWPAHAAPGARRQDRRPAAAEAKWFASMEPDYISYYDICQRDCPGPSGLVGGGAFCFAEREL